MVCCRLATSAPGYNSLRPNTAAPLAETLKLNGYRRRNSASATRCRSGRPARWARSTTGRQVAVDSSTSTGSSGARRTSTRRRSTTTRRRSSRDRTPEEGYHFTEDMTDHAIDWIRQQKALMADKPFFVYFAPGATHAPHHVPDRVVGQVQGPVRRRLGRPARARRSPGRRSSGSIPRGRRADGTAGRDPRLGRHARRD